MNFANYIAYRVAVLQMIEGDDIGATFSLDVVDLLIALGESRVYQGDGQTPGLRASTMEKALSQAVTSNAASLPSDLLELKEVYFSGKEPLEILTLDRLRAKEANGIAYGDVRFVAQNGETLRFWPQAGGTALGTYYSRPADLNTATWGSGTATFARYPELFLYATLVESANFLGMANRLQVWEPMYRAKASGAADSERGRVLAGPPMRIRAR